MINKLFILGTFIFISLLGLWSCNIKKNKMDRGTKFEFRHNEAEVFNYRVISSRRTENNPIVSFSIVNNSLLFSANTLREKKSIRRIETNFHSLSMRDEYDSIVDNTITPLQKALSAFNGAKFMFEYDTNQKITLISGYKEFKRKIDSIYQKSLNEKYPIQNPSEMLFNEDYFISTLDNIFGLVPSPLYTNSTWVKAQTIRFAEEAVDINVNYEVTKVENNIIYIKAFSPINYILGSKTASGLNITGELLGEILLDAITGTLMQSNTRITLQSSFELSGIKHCVNILETNRIEKY